MKRLFIGLMCACILFLDPVPAEAENENRFDNAGELYDYWTKTNTLPNYITGAWSSDGGYVNLTFGVTNDVAGHEGAKQILDLVADDYTVSFAYQTYPLQYLYKVQEDLEEYMEKHIGFKALGVQFLTNRVEVYIDQNRLNDPATTTAVNTLTEKYGDAVSFIFTSAQYRLTDGHADELCNQALKPMTNQANAQIPLLFTMSAITVICLAALFFSEYRRRKLLVLLTGTKAVTVQEPKVSCKAIEAAVKNAASKPSAETDAVIHKAIKH